MSGPLRRCQHCQAEIPAKAYRCTACGARLDAKLSRRKAPLLTGLAGALLLTLVLLLLILTRLA